MKTTILVLALCAATWSVAEDGTCSRTKLLAHRGLSQPYDRTGLTSQTCTADRIHASRMKRDRINIDSKSRPVKPAPAERASPHATKLAVTILTAVAYALP